MKKKLLLFVCLLTLLFVTGCNKDEQQPVPTPTTAPTVTPTATPEPTATPTPTATPIPENLAMTNLKKLPESYTTFLAQQPEAEVDYSKGLGYDIDMDLSINEDLLALLDITGLENVSLDVAMDMKDALAASGTLYLNDTEVITADFLTNFNSFLFNLPKYSTTYAVVTMEELMEEPTEEIPAFNLEDMPTNQELYALMENSLNDLVNCFEPQTGVEENLTIGTGEYVMTGEKHTVTVSRDNLLAWADALEKAFVELLGTELDLDEVTTEEETSTEDTFTNFVLHYYTDNNGSYAWELYPDNAADAPLVFISTPKGFCLYSVEEAAEEIIVYSVAASDKTGTITIPTSEEETPDVTLNYEIGDNAFSVDMEDETMEFSMNYAIKNGTITFDFEMVSEGVSVIMEETATATTADVTMTLASYGMKLGSFHMKATLRDYKEITIPQNTTDMETWESTLDQEALTADLITLMTEFPFLMDLIMGSGEEEGEDITPKSSYTPDANYSDAFMNMTGYYIDADGYVDFEPEETEIMALGAPSTGYDSLAITENQRTSLLNYAEAAFASSSFYSDNYYWVWGSTEYNDVKSYYSVEYRYTDTNNWDNSITLDFDAVSGDFIAATVCNASKDEAFRMSNELLELLNIDYEITQEAAESFTYSNGLAISGYDAAEYGGNYYSVGFEIYEE